VLTLPSATPFTDLQQQFVHVVQAVSPAVVEVRTADGLGSGIVFDHRGDIVTNAHVVGGGDRFVVTLMGGNQHRATLVGAHRTHDLAVLRLVGARPAPARGSPTRATCRSVTSSWRSGIRSGCAQA